MIRSESWWKNSRQQKVEFPKVYTENGIGSEIKEHRKFNSVHPRGEETPTRRPSNSNEYPSRNNCPPTTCPPKNELHSKNYPHQTHSTRKFCPSAVTNRQNIAKTFLRRLKSVVVSHGTEQQDLIEWLTRVQHNLQSQTPGTKDRTASCAATFREAKIGGKCEKNVRKSIQIIGLLAFYFRR